MPRYIDADELLARYKERCAGCKETPNFCEHFCDIADVISDIEDAPTEDIVEVVRCRDCEYWDSGSPLATVIPTPCRCRLRREDYGMTAEDFCSYGRRKTDATN